MIFSGSVLNISHWSQPGSTSIVQITFKVESAIRGARQGQAVRVREWGGLWNGPARYRIGERVVLVLYPASKLGLTSPVGGSMGRYEIDRSGRVVVDDGNSPPRSIELRRFLSALRRAAQEK
jgi:hypothetical protein